MTGSCPEWPGDLEETGVTHRAEVEDVARCEPGQRTLGADPEDDVYIKVMGVLEQVRRERKIILFLSDGVTSHCVSASRYAVDGRQILVEVMDPAWTNSFLHAGRNVAGICAKETDREGFLSITHHELARVYRHALTVSVTEKEDSGTLPGS